MKRSRASGDAAASALHPRKRQRVSGDATRSQQEVINEPAAPPLETNPLDKDNLLKMQTEMHWVYNGHAMVYQNVNYIPLLYTIFDEILMSAVLGQEYFTNNNIDLDVNIKVDKCCISICSFGVVHPIEKDDFNPLDTLLPENSSIRNYMAAQVSSIFSSIFSRFVITTFNGGQKCKKVLYDRYGKKRNAEITECSNEWYCTRVTFYPNQLQDDFAALMRKRVVDVGLYQKLHGDSLKVQLDGHLLNNKFSRYVDLYVPSPSKKTSKRVYQKLNEYWEVCVSLSRNRQYQQFSFVNGIVTKGGVHFDTITSLIEKHLISTIKRKKKKAKNVEIQTSDVMSHLWVFINANYPTVYSHDGSVLEEPNIDVDGGHVKFKEFLTQVARSFIFKEVFRCALKKTLALALDKANENIEANTVNENIEANPKFEDATRAGGEDSHKCTLIITEGDSAKSLVLGAVRRDYNGVLALKGKLLNVRDVPLKKILVNREINNMIKIIGLDYNKEYNDINDLKALRYGQVMIVTDQDSDGFHIKGLIINFFHFFWPSLLSDLVTPLVKAMDCTGKSPTKYFYTLPELEEWEKSKQGTDLSEWSIKYYKGLGTSTLKEGMEYFKKIDTNRKYFEWVNEEDDKAIEIAFGKDQVEERKKWIRNFQPKTFLPQIGKTRILDFIHKGLILYMMLDIQRSIPSMVDGWKKGQRKIAFTAFKNNLNKETKVAQLAAYVAEYSAYHHGEENLSNTIVGMAQDFAGSNNINVLRPSGQFDTRLEGGKDAASPRYIFTELSSITRKIFNENDDILLKYLHEDGQSVEPTWYLPILPMILVNGGKGIGTGWSTEIPCYNPRDIVHNLKLMIQGSQSLEEMKLEEMKPWFRHFHGEVSVKNQTTKKSGVTYTTSGIIDVVDKTTLKIWELPIGISMENYEKKLKSFRDNKFIKTYEKKKGGNDVEIDIHLHENSENLTQLSNTDLLQKFELTSSIGTSNMHLLDSEGRLKKYDSTEQILKEFYALRLDFYKKRKRKLVKMAERNLKIAQNKVRFIKAVRTREINYFDLNKEDLRTELREKGFEKFEQAKPSGENQDGAKAGFIKGYDYLLFMPIGNFSAEMVQGLEAECEHQEKNMTELKKTSAKELWLKDLHAFEEELDANVPSDAQRTTLLRDPALLRDLESLAGTKWITDGVVQRIFDIFSKTTFNNKKILLLGEATELTSDMDAIARLPLLHYSLVFIPLKSALVSIPLKSAQMRPSASDAGVYFSLLVFYNTKKGTHMFCHYDTVGTANRAVAESVADSIKKVIPAFAKEDVYDPPVPQQQDPYNSGVYVLAITEVICEWFMKTEESAHELRYKDSVMSRVKELSEVDTMRMKYYQMILNHEDVHDPEPENTSTEQENNSAQPENTSTEQENTSAQPENTSAEKLNANVTPVRKDDGLTEDLKSLGAGKWITDGVINRIFSIFSKTTFNHKKILLMPQDMSASLRQNRAAITSSAMLDCKLVFISLNNAQLSPCDRSDDGDHFSLLVLDNMEEGRPKFRHFDTLHSFNKRVAEYIAQCIIEEIPDTGKEEIDYVHVPQQVDSYNCGVYVLAITEAICKWFMENQESAHRSGYDPFVMNMIQDPIAVNNMRRKYYHMILNHVGVPDPA